MSTLSEQVRELEARAFEAERQVSRCIDERNEFLRTIKVAQDAQRAAESRLAQARVEGARKMAEDIARAWRSEFHAEARVLGEVGHDFIQSFARRYPAVPEGGEPCPHVDRDARNCCICRPTPTPERITEPVRLVLRHMLEQNEDEPFTGRVERFVDITPADARRIVSLAAQDGGSQ